jgi:hypothetical protein
MQHGSARAPKRPDFAAPDAAGEMARPKVAQGAVAAAGSVVLASVGAGEGWWEAWVLEAHDDLVTLQWRDSPDEPVFVRRKSQIALLFPTSTATV